jgi:hypothetical protein
MISGRTWSLVRLLTLIAGQSAIADLWREDFMSDPFTRGWRVQGDPSHFSWQQGAGRLAVTWDSRRPNAFFHLPLPTILTRADSFRFRFQLVLDNLATDSPETTFQLAVGLMGRTRAFEASSYRGAGIHPTWGVRNLVEFTYFPASSSIAPTFSAVAVATNNTRWATLDLFPLELETGATYDIEVRHDASASRVSLRALRNGAFCSEGSMTLSPGFGDFRLDTFSVTSYSGDHQPANYGGHLLAHGSVDEIELEFPTPPRPTLALQGAGHAPHISLAEVPGWIPFLERHDGNTVWAKVPVEAETSSGKWTFIDPTPPTNAALYRVRLERP